MPWSTATSPPVLTSTAILGTPVRNRAGEDLGKIHELMIDVEKGKVAYAVLTLGGFLGMVGNKLFAIPWSALTMNFEDRSLILNVAKERLERAPDFSKNAWPNMADLTWGNRIHRYYGQSPYWE